MSWWKPLVIIPVLIVLMLVVQIVIGSIVMIIEMLVTGVQPPMDGAAPISPWMMLAANLSIALMAPIAILLMRFLGRVPVRDQFSIRRSPSWGRLALYTGVFLILLLVVNAIVVLVDPGMLQSVNLSAGVILLIAIALLTTPLQAAAEEIMFRSAIMPAIGSWIRPAKVAVAVALIASSVIFGVMHASVDPWLLTYYVLFGVCTGLMAIISRGLEAPIAFHVVNNVVMMVLAALGTEDGYIAIDRSVGTGGPFMLIYIGMDLVAVALVWLFERRRRAAEADGTPQAVESGDGGVAQPTA